MKIAFASEHPNQIGAFSGIPFYMVQALHKAAESFTFIETPAYKLEHVLHDRDIGQSELQKAGEFLSRRLETIDVDVVICLGSSMIPYLQTNKPVILWHDSTWLGGLQLELDSFKTQYPLLYEWDRKVLERCDLILFAADWVRDQAIQAYRVSPTKVHSVPFGANMLPHSFEAVDTFVHERRQLPCQLTFLGIDWRRKGLPLAYEVCRELNERGVSTVMNVIGCQVEKIGPKRRLKHFTGWERLTPTERFQLKFHTDPHIRQLGFLHKDDPVQAARLEGVLRNTHFLLHPASFECFGIALVEANAFGVPVLATDAHGPQTIIRNGVNGYRFEPKVFVDQAVALIQEHIEDPQKYRALALQSWQEQRTRLDWDQSVRKLFYLIENHIFRPPQSRGPTKGFTRIR